MTTKLSHLGFQVLPTFLKFPRKCNGLKPQNGKMKLFFEALINTGFGAEIHIFDEYQH
jgi:hypothetical protein